MAARRPGSASSADRRRPRRRGVHLLGLGHLRVGERGGQGLQHDTRPRRRAVAPSILLAIYLVDIVSARSSLLGPEFVTDNADDAIYALGKVALPTIMVKLLLIAVLTSAAASCQTTILPATRTMLSMGCHGAAPAKLARIDPKRLTPDYSTWLFGIVSIVVVPAARRSSATTPAPTPTSPRSPRSAWPSPSTTACPGISLHRVLPAVPVQVAEELRADRLAARLRRRRAASTSSARPCGTPAVPTTATARCSASAPCSSSAPCCWSWAIPLMLVVPRKYPRFFSYRPDPARPREGPERRRHAGCPAGHLPKGSMTWPVSSSWASAATAAASRPRGEPRRSPI